MRRRDEAKTLDYGVAYLWGFKARDQLATSCRSRKSWASPRIAASSLGRRQGRADRRADTRCHRLYCIPDTLNTDVRRADWIIPKLARGVQFRLSANYTDQRTIGEELMPGSPFETSQASGRVAASYHDATISSAISENGKGADLQRPVRQLPRLYGARPAQFQRCGRDHGRRRRGLRFLAYHHSTG